ncbi:MAG: hypothetical protein JWL84_3656 [Rhodospirillales bacterium]|nr:hypothetical protein [Rhodospirillales bacterium]
MSGSAPIFLALLNAVPPGSGQPSCDRGAFARVTLAAAGLSALLGACSPPQSTLFANDAPAAVAASAIPNIDVLSGEVLVVDGRHFRMVNVTAPQPAPHAHCAAEALGARQARLRIRELAQGARKVTVIPTGSRDDHNRALATVYLDGVDPAQVLIDEGLAVAPQTEAFDWCAPMSDTIARGKHIAMLSMAGS